jgi:serine/threonine-protein kinase RsbW
MATQTKRVHITLDTLLDSVDVAEDVSMRVAVAAGFADEDCHKIGMAVREAVINAYNYGNQGERSKKIFLTMELEGSKMVVHVLDEGKGFEVTEVPDPLLEENLLRCSGRGLFLMRAFMDEFTVQRGPGGGAEVVMAKRLGPGGSPNGGPTGKGEKEG